MELLQLQVGKLGHNATDVSVIVRNTANGIVAITGRYTWSYYHGCQRYSEKYCQWYCCNNRYVHLVILPRMSELGRFSRAKFSAKVFVKVARLTIYCNDFSWDYNGFSISIDS